MNSFDDKNKNNPYDDFIISDKKIITALNRRKIKLNSASNQIEGLAYRCKVDEDWTMEYLSSNVSKLTGYKAEELYNNRLLSWNDLIYYADQKKVKKTINKFINENKIFNVEYRITTGNGDIKWVREDGKPVYENDRITAIEGYIHDITEIKSNEKELTKINNILEKLVEERTNELKNSLKKLNSEIEIRKIAEKKLFNAFKQEKQINKMKTEFINILCHEFRNPLAIIKSSSQLVRAFTKENSEENILRHLNKIELNVELMSDMINKFLSLERYKDKYAIINKKSLDINELCSNLINQIQDNSISEFKIVYKFDSKIKMVNCDENLLRLALKNILQNAVKYSPAGEKIEFIVTNSHKHLTISIIDYGRGIKKDDIKLIFKKFYRGRNNKTVDGYGIGLNIAKKIVKLHQGKIKIKSKENQGTRVSISLPL